MLPFVLPEPEREMLRAVIQPEETDKIKAEQVCDVYDVIEPAVLIGAVHQNPDDVQRGGEHGDQIDGAEGVQIAGPPVFQIHGQQSAQKQDAQ